MQLTEKLLREVIREELISLTEGNKFEVHYSDGIRGSEEFKKEADAIQYAKGLIQRLKQLQFVSVHKPGMSSTADKEDLVAWWGKGSYWDNLSKKDKELENKYLLD